MEQEWLELLKCAECVGAPTYTFDAVTRDGWVRLRVTRHQVEALMSALRMITESH